MNKSKNISGFTLIELIVVITIAGLLAFFSFPAFKGFNVFSGDKGSLGDVVILINDLKKRAVSDGTDYILNIDAASGSLWVTSMEMDDSGKEKAREQAVRLSDKLSITEVQFADKDRRIDNVCALKFSRSGYSEHALIRVRDGQSSATIEIEPFLPKARIVPHHIYFENCI